jgi:transcriptional regulator with XRE-family HTH domain
MQFGGRIRDLREQRGLTQKGLGGSIVEDILELSLGPISGSRLPVSFRGVRRRRNGCEEAETISVNGDCELDAR